MNENCPQYLDFDAAAYLARYVDLRNAGITLDTALKHWCEFGRNENRSYKADVVVPPIVPPVPIPITDPITISGVAGTSSITIQALPRYAGAIDSLKWNGKEFLDAQDHGRLLQSGIQFDNLGEGYNPTEAGAKTDYATSTSVLLSASATANQLKTKTQMAFWTPVGAEKLSSIIMEKVVTIGHPESAHIIEYHVYFKVPEAHGNGQWEALTGYLPGEFATFNTFNPVTEAVGSLAGGPANEKLPLIFSASADFAMGIYSPDLTEIDGKGSGYCWFSPAVLGDDVSKWSLWFQTAVTPPEEYSLECYVIVGTLAEVKTAMMKLHSYLYSTTPPVVPPVVPPVTPTLPADFNPAAYLAYWKDVRDSGMTAEYHYLHYGYKEGRWPLPVVPPPWVVPTEKGLHLVLSQDNGREIFSVIKTPTGLMVGDYGLNKGGPIVQTFDGLKWSKDAQFSECESVYDLYMPEDGRPLLTNEWYGNIRKRNASGVWETKFKASDATNLNLTFLIRRAGNNLYANYFKYSPTVISGGLYEGDLNGNGWSEIAHYSDKSLYGMTSDGTNIYLAGKTGVWTDPNGYPILCDASGRILSGRTDLRGQQYCGVCKVGSSFVMGSVEGASPGHIDLFDGTKNTTVYKNERTTCYIIGLYEGKLYTVFTWDWDKDASKTSLLISSSDGGKTWTEVCKIPCPHIIGLRFADSGLYMCGGKYATFGRLYFYKF